MKTKTTLLIVGLVVLSMMVVFATPAMADEDPEGVSDDPIKFYGTILDGGSAWAGTVTIQKSFGSMWWTVGSDATDSSGDYETAYKHVFTKSGTYRMKLNGNVVEETYLAAGDFTWEGRKNWSKEWDYGEIPEFSTIALPVASILGLLFFFNYRKRRKE